MASSSSSSSSSFSKLREWFPTTQRPLIISAPMLGVANGTLAAAVSRAGGLGMIPGGYNFESGDGNAQLKTLEAELITARKELGLADKSEESLPLGVGFITFHESLKQFEKTALPLLVKHRVQAIWLFAPRRAEGEAAASPHSDVIRAARQAGIKVFVQVGTVAAAREAARDGADVIVAQGTDGGGHQFARGAGLMSVVPEMRQLIEEEIKDRDVALVAAGGIADGKGVAAALALGAEGAVMGTRFILSNEATVPEFRRKLLLETRDGAAMTVKSSFHDDIQGQSMWPVEYDGRAIDGASHKDHLGGMSLEENRRLLKECQEKGGSDRVVDWCGASIGIINEILPAGEIVRKARVDAKRKIALLQSSI